MKLHQLAFATGNEGKIREARQILGIEIERVKIELDEIQSIDVTAVVEHKAKQAFEIVGKPVLVEDTGLSFTALNGLPGALVKWFDVSIGNEGLIRLLKECSDRSAVATSCFAVYDGRQLISKIGQIHGTISTIPKGDDGFGWDPIFIPDGFDQTFAQMNPEQKNSMSMRTIALSKLQKQLK